MKTSRYYNLNYEYRLYLKAIGIKEDDLHPEQAQQLYQLFKAGCRATLKMVDNLSRIKDKILVSQLLTDFSKQANDLTKLNSK